MSPFYNFDRYAKHLAGCDPPYGDMGCKCGYSAVRFNLLELIAEEEKREAADKNKPGT